MNNAKRFILPDWFALDFLPFFSFEKYNLSMSFLKDISKSALRVKTYGGFAITTSNPTLL
ncbi:hypothetical protein ES703_46740 [subsurface metagenome]